jgi:pimeloyl-ACP methyl ester carboxylesterase
MELEILRRGAGRPILIVHGVNPVPPNAAFVDGLAAHGSVVAPSHPGFGASPMPEDFETMYDLVNLYQDIIDDLPGDDVTMIGLGFGGWIAAEVAVTRPSKLRRLVLADPVGIKLADREERDFPHLFNTRPDELTKRAWHDPARIPENCYGLGWQALIDERMSDAAMVSLARNWDSLCLYAWTPHMYNPRLKVWLRRISVPTLVLWGESDRIVTPDYGRAYAGLIPGSRFETIPNAGHHPEMEQPAAFNDKVVQFMTETTRP